MSPFEALFAVIVIFWLLSLCTRRTTKTVTRYTYSDKPRDRGDD